MALSDRTFGVEIEHGNLRFMRGHDDAFDAMEGELDSAGFKDWTVHGDGSGFEVVSPVLKGEDGLNMFKDCLSFLQGLGGAMHRSDGFHVHHGAKEFVNNDARVLRLVRSWANNQEVINRMVAPHRGPGAAAIQGTHCFKQVDETFVTGLEGLLADDPYRSSRTTSKKCGAADRFRAINVRALEDHGTIEIRQHEGTFDYERCAAWIRFGQKFIETSLASEEPIGQCSSPSAFMRSLGVDSHDINKLRRVACAS